MTQSPQSWIDDQTGLPQVFLLPGAIHCSATPSTVRTVLGSCVAVCLLDRARGVSSINHFLLPRGDGAASLRYGDVAIDRLVAEMRGLGCQIQNIEAKLFGGAAVLPINNIENHVGARNVEAAIAHLGALGIPIVAQRTGGINGLAIRLLTASGDVLVRRVASSMAQQADEALPSRLQIARDAR